MTRSLTTMKSDMDATLCTAADVSVEIERMPELSVLRDVPLIAGKGLTWETWLDKKRPMKRIPVLWSATGGALCPMPACCAFVSSPAGWVSWLCCVCVCGCVWFWVCVVLDVWFWV